jgi:cell division protein FtsL
MKALRRRKINNWKKFYLIMSKLLWIVVVLVLVVLSFLVGSYINQSGDSSEIEQIRLQVAQLENEKKELQERIDELELSDEDQCMKIKDESDAYYQQFQEISCSSDSDCVGIIFPATCGECVHNSIDQGKIDDYNNRFNSNECTKFQEYNFGCSHIVLSCGCNNNVCGYSI